VLCKSFLRSRRGCWGRSFRRRSEGGFERWERAGWVGVESVVCVDMKEDAMGERKDILSRSASAPSPIIPRPPKRPVTDLGEKPHKLSHAPSLIKAKAAEVVDLAEDGRGGGRGRVDGEEGDGVDLHGGGDSVCGVDVLCVCVRVYVCIR
jgi:hypothetical protein